MTKPPLPPIPGELYACGPYVLILGERAPTCGPRHWYYTCIRDWDNVWRTSPVSGVTEWPINDITGPWRRVDHDEPLYGEALKHLAIAALTGAEI